MTPENFKEILDRYTRGVCTEEEKQLVDAWYANIQSENTDHPDNLENQLWAKLQPVKANTTVGRRATWLKIAASVALLIAAATFYLVLQPVNSDATIAARSESNRDLISKSSTIEIRNDDAVIKNVTLDDGSQVSLQPQSTLTISENFSSGARVVSLRGEAFFDVERDTLRPFYVYAGDVVTKVLGTSFTVRAIESDKKITVAVKTGKVSVSTKPGVSVNQSSSEVILTPNQKAVYDSEVTRVKKEFVEKPEVILPKPTIFKMKYEETPVSEIFRVLAENYGVEFEYDEEIFADCHLTTKMSNEGLFERVEIICTAIGATYTLDDAVIRIEGKGCR